MTAYEMKPRTPVTVMICCSDPTMAIVASSGTSLRTVSRDNVRMFTRVGLQTRATSAAMLNCRGRPSTGVEKGQSRDAATVQKNAPKGSSTRHQLMPEGG